MRGPFNAPGIVEAVVVAWTCGRDVPAHARVLRAGIAALLVREPTWAGWELRLALLEARAGEVDAAAARLAWLPASPLRRGEDLAVALRTRPEAIARALRTSPAVGLEELARAVDVLDRSRGASARP
ncbi:MAG: hypothetical protein KF878_13320 [Planctomycetes bacterium]|nr:hypothetical protein [Planctomycetota bacterium]